MTTTLLFLILKRVSLHVENFIKPVYCLKHDKLGNKYVHKCWLLSQRNYVLTCALLLLKVVHSCCHFLSSLVAKCCAFLFAESCALLFASYIRSRDGKSQLIRSMSWGNIRIVGVPFVGSSRERMFWRRNIDEIGKAAAASIRR